MNNHLRRFVFLFIASAWGCGGAEPSTQSTVEESSLRCPSGYHHIGWCSHPTTGYGSIANNACSNGTRMINHTTVDCGSGGYLYCTVLTSGQAVCQYD
jgi:hypothetical protein